MSGASFPLETREIAPVRAWREGVTIPTYGIGDANRNPMFLENRVYQGSSGAVYPLPVIDRVADDKRDRVWNAVFLENAFLKIMILPELGGRVQMALDKTNDYHFVYHNRVIKPALVGLAGPWISGGIEFNWPQHHRPSTFMPVDCEISEGGGSATVWLHEIDRMHRTECTHRFTLRPDRAVLEIDVELFNRTELPQTFLWWANPAVHVDENHQSVFPPDVSAVMDHGKRDTSAFPIATGEYYKVDYAPGTDISRYRNIPVPTSYMAHHSNYDFVGSYDHGRAAGLLHVCNHHVAPGKKQWTWGTADFGQAWERHLTDEDGPYIELMCGVYTDNQPDFSWLMPGEAKTFTQYFIPYQGVGMVKNATVKAAIGLDGAGDRATVRAYTTSPQPNAKVSVHSAGAAIWEGHFDGGPGSSFQATFPLPKDIPREGLQISVVSRDGEQLVDWTVPRKTEPQMPDPAKPIETPNELDSVESLYLAGLHLEQYRHATRQPENYYREALRRDRGDARCNMAIGKLLYRRGRFADAEPYLRRTIERVIRHNPNPYDGEPYYLLGCTLEKQERYDEAYAAYHKAVWNAAWQDTGYFALARLDCRAGRLHRALENVDRCLGRNASHRQARHFKAVLLGRLQRQDEAKSLLDLWLSEDPCQAGLVHERFRDEHNRGEDLSCSRIAMRVDQHGHIELALDYAAAGLYRSAAGVLEQYLQSVDQQPETAIVFYFLADWYSKAGDDQRAGAMLLTAADYRPDYCFPNRLEEIGPLARATQGNKADARAPYYLGNLWYDRQQYDLAIDCWEQARQRDPTFATVWRNLGLAYFNKRHDAEAAWQALNEAFRLDDADSRVLFEFDQLAKRLGHSPRKRLDRLSRHPALVDQRDDLSLEYVTLLNVLGRHQQALECLLARNFHPWEGGEGKVPAQYTLCLTQLARKSMAAGDLDDALDWLRQADDWPLSLGEGKLPNHQDNHVRYWQGVALTNSGRDAEAREALERAAQGIGQPCNPMYYNDQPPDMIFYQGRALKLLGRHEAAAARFQSLIDYGHAHLEDEPEIDFFAVSLPDFLVFEENLKRRNAMHCRYMIALGLLGKNRPDEAVSQLDQILAIDPSHLGGVIHHPSAHHPSAGADHHERERPCRFER